MRRNSHPSATAGWVYAAQLSIIAEWTQYQPAVAGWVYAAQLSIIAGWSQYHPAVADGSTLRITLSAPDEVCTILGGRRPAQVPKHTHSQSGPLVFLSLRNNTDTTV